MEKSMQTGTNREYKDRLFKWIFREKEDLLELYNALNDTAYEDADEIEVNTLEDVIYLSMKNDISFVLQEVLNLYEHQSTMSPNLPLRGLFYFAESKKLQKVVDVILFMCYINEVCRTVRFYKSVHLQNSTTTGE